jgi:hypothetical protein
MAGRFGRPSALAMWATARETPEPEPVAQPPPTIECEDEPRDEAPRMNRRPQMHSERSHARKEHIPSLDKTAPRMPLPPGVNPATMQNRSLRLAAELGIPVTLRKTPGGRLCWRSTDEDRQPATERARRRQTPPPKAGRVTAAVRIER